MTDFNFSWLKENFSEQDTVVFYIGAADGYDASKMTEVLSGTVYMFECASVWHDKCLHRAKHNDRLFYQRIAVSDIDGESLYWPSEKFFGNDHPWSGSILEPKEGIYDNQLTFGEPITVYTKTLETLCNEYKVIPDFIHIDTQGSEFKIFNAMPDHIRPKAIWAETSEFSSYNIGVTRQEFDDMLLDKGYRLAFQATHDALYIHETQPLSDYTV